MKSIRLRGMSEPLVTRMISPGWKWKASCSQPFGHVGVKGETEL